MFNQFPPEIQQMCNRLLDLKDKQYEALYEKLKSLVPEIQDTLAKKIAWKLSNHAIMT